MRWVGIFAAALLFACSSGCGPRPGTGASNVGPLRERVRRQAGAIDELGAEVQRIGADVASLGSRLTGLDERLDSVVAALEELRAVPPAKAHAPAAPTPPVTPTSEPAAGRTPPSHPAGLLERLAGEILLLRADLDRLRQKLGEGAEDQPAFRTE